jgi:hypothetical protein
MKTLTLSAVLLSSAVVSFASGARAESLFVEGDIVRGAQKGAPGPACVLNNQFKHLEKVVWRFRVRDQSGKVLDEKSLKSLVVELPDGQKISAAYGPHGPPNAPVDHFWTAIWVIPATYPNGAFTYKALATGGDGGSATWEPFLSKPSQLQVMPGEIEIKNP